VKKTLIAAPIALFGLVALLVAGLTTGVVGGQFPSPQAYADIPPQFLAFYQAAANTCPGLNWTVLAGIGKVESDHGRSTAPGVHSGVNFAGAAGPMQFGVGGKAGNTWGAYGVDGSQPPDGVADVYDPADAIFTAARYLCANGASANVQQAIFAYNHAGWYVDKVLAQARTYATAPPVLAPGTAVGLSDSARTAISFALNQLGTPYRWGGTGPGGFDCSGLVQAAYAAAGVTLPRTAQAQYNAGPLLPPGMPPQAGDLVFFGGDAVHVTHVGLMVNSADMVDAPHTGSAVRVEVYHWGTFVGATRPAPVP
jgi:cell wall-associated NlpC family hydrolase